MHRWLADRTASLIPITNNALVLDVASGTGLAGWRLRELVPTARVVALDLAGKLLRVARKDRLSVAPTDAERLPIASGLDGSRIYVVEQNWLVPIGYHKEKDVIASLVSSNRLESQK